MLRPLRTRGTGWRLLGIAKCTCLSAHSSLGAALNGLSSCTRPFRFAKGYSDGQRETDVLPLRSTAGSLLAAQPRGPTLRAPVVVDWRAGHSIGCAHWQSAPPPPQQALPMGTESAKCPAAAGRNARGGCGSPLDSRAPVIGRRRSTGTRRFLRTMGS